jgi:DNA-binding transcriptional ArsR family regulator
MAENSRLINFARMLADDTRQTIMNLLCCRELSVNDVVRELKTQGKEVSQPTVSHHLAELRDANLVKVRPEGRQMIYTLNQAEVSICCGQIMATLAPEVELIDLES